MKLELLPLDDNYKSDKAPRSEFEANIELQRAGALEQISFMYRRDIDTLVNPLARKSCQVAYDLTVEKYDAGLLRSDELLLSYMQRQTRILSKLNRDPNATDLY